MTLQCYLLRGILTVSSHYNEKTKDYWHEYNKRALADWQSKSTEAIKILQLLHAEDTAAAQQTLIKLFLLLLPY